MAVDIAVLGLEVRSDGVVVASDRLKQLTAEGGKAEQATGKLSSSFSNLEKYVKAAQAAFAAAGIGMFVKSSIDAALQVERMTKLFNAATGSANLAARELEYVRGVTNKLGLDLVSTTESYGKFMASIRGTTLEGERGRKIFESVSGATTALGLRADETAGVFKALEQMMSKGKVQAEELRGQLGERLPGAFGMAAKAMNMSTAELDKQLALGNVMADDLLPKLAEQLEKTYGKAALEGANSAQAAINRMNNAMLESKSTLGSALMPVFTDFMTHVLTPIVKLMGDFVRSLQTAAATIAYVTMQAGGGMKDLLTGKVFSKQGYAESMADAEENKRIYQKSLDDIWKQPGAGAYTAAELARQALNKSGKPATDDKAASAAAKWATTIAGLRKEIDALQPGLDKHDKSVLDVTLKYDELIKKKGANIALLKTMKSEHLAAIEARRKMDEAMKESSKELDEYRQATEALAAFEKSYWQGIANTAKQVESLQPGSATTALGSQIDAIYEMTEKLPDMASKAATAIEALLKLRERQQETEDINNSMIEDPYQRELAQIETLYNRKLELIDQERTALMGLQDQSSDNFEKWLEYQKAIEQFDDKETALRKKNSLDSATVAEKAYKSQLSMASQYTGLAGQMFQTLASTQDQTSKSGFETAKAFNMAATVMNTATAIMNAMATAPFPLSIAQAGVAAATGVIQLAQIASTSFGGGGSIVAPSGSVAATGGASGADSGLMNRSVPLSLLQDNRTDETYQRLIDSNVNVAVAIGRLSKSVDDLGELFKSSGLITNAPGRSVITSDNESGWQQAYSATGLRAFVDFNTSLLSLDFKGALKALDPSRLIKGLSGGLFGGSTTTTGAGIQFAVQNGTILAFDYLNKKKDGGWGRRDKNWIEVTENTDLAGFMTAMFDPYINGISNMARTLNLGFNPESYSAEPTSIKTTDRTEEEIAADIEKWAQDTLNGIALTVDGLQDSIGTWDNAYEMLSRYNDALVTANNNFELIGKATIEGSIANAQAVDALQTLMGGVDSFTESVDTYFSNLFTDAEQEAALAAQAQRDLDRAFTEMGKALPATRQEFRDLVNSLDITTVSGAQLFASLMDVSEAFGLVMDAADQASEELADAVRAALESALDVAAGNLQAAFAAEKNRLTAQYNAELATLNEQLQFANGVVSTLTGYVNKLVSARQRMQLQDAAYQRDQYTAAQAMLAATLVAARSGDLSSLGNMDESLAILTSQGEESYANSTDYRRDFMRTKSGIVELERLAGHQLTDAQRQVTLAQQQIDLLKTNHDAQIAALDAQLNALLGINNSVLSLADASMAYKGANTAKQAQRDSTIMQYVNGVVATGSATAGIDIYAAAIANKVSADELAKATYSTYGMTAADLNAWAEANGLPRFANGGITSGISIAGEAGPEAVVPLPDGRRIPVQMTGQADNAELIAEVRALRGEVIQLKAATTQISKASQKQLQYTEDWDANGLPEVRTA